MKIEITPIDKAHEESGAWGRYRGIPLLIARANNSRFRAIFKKLSKPLSREIEKGTISEADSEEILCESLSVGILMGWKEFEIKGEEVEYTKENAKQLLANDPDCREYVQNYSQDIDNYLKDDLEDTKEK